VLADSGDVDLFPPYFFVQEAGMVLGDAQTLAVSQRTHCKEMLTVPVDSRTVELPNVLSDVTMNVSLNLAVI